MPASQGLTVGQLAFSSGDLGGGHGEEGECEIIRQGAASEHLGEGGDGLCRSLAPRAAPDEDVEEEGGGGRDQAEVVGGKEAG